MEGCSGDGIRYIDPSKSPPDSPPLIPVSDGLYGLTVHHSISYWTEEDGVYKAPVDTGIPREMVRKVEDDERLKGMIVVR